VRRWYRSADAVPADGGFAIVLDGKPLHTPARAPVVLPTRALADAVAAEWGAQGDAIRLPEMRLTRMAATALDQIRPDPTHAIAQIAEYATTDLLCHRAEAPEDLRRRQEALWQPVLDWAVLRYDAPLRVVAGVMPGRQSAQALAAIRTAVAAYDAMHLAGLLVATTGMGSVLLALALAERHIDVERAWAAAELDEAYQREKWGEDPLAARRRAEIETDLRAAARFLDLLRA
jgi:chaperone required for assembly of F1-ATPase